MFYGPFEFRTSLDTSILFNGHMNVLLNDKRNDLKFKLTDVPS